jgi:Flp pilus assembly protein CpaB
VAATTAAWGVAGAVGSLEETRRQWGDTVTVWVAARDLAPGDPIEAAPHQHPRAVVAAASLGRDPTGLVALQHIAAGEPVMEADVGRSGLELLPAGWRGVGVASVDGALALAPGQRVDVVASGQLLADEAVVVAASGTSVTVGVPSDVAASVADAALRHEVSLVVRPD